MVAIDSDLLLEELACQRVLERGPLLRRQLVNRSKLPLNARLALAHLQSG
jgi:hypothetical protein